MFCRAKFLTESTRGSLELKSRFDEFQYCSNFVWQIIIHYYQIIIHYYSDKVLFMKISPMANNIVLTFRIEISPDVRSGLLLRDGRFKCSTTNICNNFKTHYGSLRID